MNGKVVNSHPDLLVGQLSHELIPGDTQLFQPQQQRIEMQAVTRIRSRRRWQNRRQLDKRRVVLPPNRPPPFPMELHFRQLVNSNGGLQVHHVIFEPAFHYLVMPIAFVGKTLPGITAHAVQREDLHPAQSLRSARQNHPAFTTGHILGHIKTETTDVAERSAGPSMIG